MLQGARPSPCIRLRAQRWALSQGRVAGEDAVTGGGGEGRDPQVQRATRKGSQLRRQSDACVWSAAGPGVLSGRLPGPRPLCSHGGQVHAVPGVAALVPRGELGGACTRPGPVHLRTTQDGEMQIALRRETQAPQEC